MIGVLLAVGSICIIDITQQKMLQYIAHICTNILGGKQEKRHQALSEISGFRKPYLRL